MFLVDGKNYECIRGFVNFCSEPNFFTVFRGPSYTPPSESVRDAGAHRPGGREDVRRGAANMNPRPVPRAPRPASRTEFTREYRRGKKQSF